jgi:hypothetical protein
MASHLSLLPSLSLSFFFLLFPLLFLFFFPVPVPVSVSAAFSPHRPESTDHRAVHRAVHPLLHAVHRVASRICQGSQIGFLKARSTFLRQNLPATHLSTVLTGVLRSIRHHPFLLPTSTRRRVDFTRSRVDLTRGRVDLTRRSVCSADHLVSAEAAGCRIFCYFSVFFLVFMLFVFFIWVTVSLFCSGLLV